MRPRQQHRRFDPWLLNAILAGALVIATTLLSSARAAQATAEILTDAEIGQAGGTAQVAAAAVTLPPMPPGPFQPTWDSIKENYKSPAWFSDAKFGLSMHWGLYSVPARQSEWYVRYMYGGNAGKVGKITRVNLLGHSGDLQFMQDSEGLKVTLPADRPCEYAFGLEINGLKLR